MITRFKEKLRIAGLGDRLQSELGLPSNTADWLCRMANDCAQQDGLELLSIRADVVADSVFWQLERGGHADLLDRLAQGNPRLASKLARYRDSRLPRAA